MRILHKSIFVAACVVPLALLFEQAGYCTTMTKTSLEEQGRPGMVSMKSAGLDNTENLAEPIVIDKQFPLALSPPNNARLQSVATSWQPVSSPQFESSGDGRTGLASAPNQTYEPVQTGFLTWQITPNGTQVFDNKTRQYANIAALTSLVVRPRDIVFNERMGTVWLYGETLYRYRIAEHTLDRLQPTREAFQAIRKAVTGPYGLWLATENGIFLLDEKGATLKKMGHSELVGASFINAAATDKEAWFVTADGRLVRFASRTQDQVDFSMSATLPIGTPAEIIIANQTLWMLLSSNHGDHYKLAYADIGMNQINVMAGKYFSLSAKDGQLLASAYSTLFRIDPSGKTITKLKLTEEGLLARAARNESVLFLGSSYAYRDNCEIVEHGQIDISKGWINALSDLIFR